MTDLRDRFKAYEEIPVPDLWKQVTDLAAGRPAVRQPPRVRVGIASSAAVLALLVVGVPLALFGLSTSSGMVEPTPTTLGWESLEVAKAPIASAMVEMPGGGYVALAGDTSDVFWSPNGSDWFDADPNGQLALAPSVPSGSPVEGSQMAGTRDSVIIVDQVRQGVWVGDRTTGRWDFIRLEAEDPADALELLTVTTNDRDGLVVARQHGLNTLMIPDSEEPLSIPETDGYLAWIIRNGEAERYRLPTETPEWTVDAHALAVWFNERWTVALYRGKVMAGDEGWEQRQTLLTSADGGVWSTAEAPDGWGFVTSLTAGPASMIATTCHFGGDSFWYSTDGAVWEHATSAHLGHRSVYVDGLGFVAKHGDSPWVVSAEGREWRSLRQHGVALQTLARDTEGIDGPDARSFVFDSRLWIWSAD